MESPNTFMSAVTARQPVQWPAAITLRPKSFMASTVAGMIGSFGPDRWKPPATA